MNQYELFFLSIIEISMIVVLFHGFYNNCIRNLKVTIGFVVIGSLSVAIIGTVIKNNVTSHLICTMSTYLLFMLYSKKSSGLNKTSRTLLFFLVIIIVGIIQLIGMMGYMLLKLSFEYEFVEGIVSQLFGLIICVVAIKVLPFKSLNLYIEEKNMYFVFTIVNIFIIFYSLSIFWYIDYTNIVKSIIEILLLVIVTLFINIVFARENLLNKGYKKQIAMYETYRPIIQNLIDKVRETQHDYNSRINTMMAFKEITAHENLEPLDKYLKEASKEEIWTKLLKINNEMIMALFYSIIYYCIRQGY